MSADQTEANHLRFQLADVVNSSQKLKADYDASQEALRLYVEGYVRVEKERDQFAARVKELEVLCRRIHMTADLGPEGNSYLIITEKELDLLVSATAADPVDARALIDALATNKKEIQ